MNGKKHKNKKRIERKETELHYSVVCFKCTLHIFFTTYHNTLVAKKRLMLLMGFV